MLYGIGALLSAVSPGLGVLILGNSVFEGVGTALLIPPVYILTTLAFSDLTSRARAFGVISGMGGIGAAAGPLIGGLITTAISWRAAFVFQALVVVAIIVLLSRRVADPIEPDPTRPFDASGRSCRRSACSSWCSGSCRPTANPALMAVLLAAGAAFLVWFFLYIRARERAGKEPLLSTGLFKNRTSNLGLVTQNIQWLLLMGTSFVVAVFLQTVRGYNAIETGVIFTAATVGVLVSSLAAERLAKRRAQKTLIIAGFVVTMAGIGLLLALVGASSRVVAFVPGLLLIGLGLGVMLTPSVNVVQSELPRASCRARSRACRAASPTSARPSARRSPARSWSPTSPRETVLRPRDGRPGRPRRSSASPPPCCSPPTPSSGARRMRSISPGATAAARRSRLGLRHDQHDRREREQDAAGGEHRHESEADRRCVSP